MSKKILFVIGGLQIGGVETYIVRLSKVLHEQGHKVHVIILSNKYEEALLGDLNKCASVNIIENVPSFPASSWINGQLHLKASFGEFDIAHTVDMLTLWFLFINKDKIKFNHLSTGIYHSAELNWWMEKGAYFRNMHITLFKQNLGATLFPSESIVQAAEQAYKTSLTKAKILPLGINLSRYTNCNGSKKTHRIISIGRLVNFKTYNRHVISLLPQLRQFGDYEYHIYGSGPELNNLQKLARDHRVFEYVHFKGETSYESLPEILNGSFCFVGSGTSIIEASAAGIPSIIGIESSQTPYSSGFFCEITGYSYNESYASANRVNYFNLLKELHDLTDDQFNQLCARHKEKARQFDISVTSKQFISLSDSQPRFDLIVQQWRCIPSFLWSILRFGPKALKGRFLQTEQK